MDAIDLCLIQIFDMRSTDCGSESTPAEAPPIRLPPPHLLQCLGRSSASPLFVALSVLPPPLCLPFPTQPQLVSGDRDEAPGCRAECVTLFAGERFLEEDDDCTQEFKNFVQTNKSLAANKAKCVRTGPLPPLTP